jgi:hypothetical protein
VLAQYDIQEAGGEHCAEHVGFGVERVGVSDIVPVRTGTLNVTAGGCRPVSNDRLAVDGVHGENCTTHRRVVAIPRGPAGLPNGPADSRHAKNTLYHEQSVTPCQGVPNPRAVSTSSGHKKSHFLLER